ncbi:MAG TPA: cytochrome c, partial [Nannocystaceae bacterium]|nr:cytochrome c [Nannocystaceae bacterium]
MSNRLLPIAIVCITACASEPTPSAGDDDSSTGAGTTTSAATTAAVEDGSSSSTGAHYGPDDGEVTFYRDVLPIFGQRCLMCHSDDNIAPMSLFEYETAWTWKESVAVAVEQRSMPPWLPGPDCASYANDRSITQDEIDTIVSWVDLDGPRGNPDDA